MQEYHNCDNMHPEKGIQNFPKKFFTLGLLDPPYGINMGGANNHKRKSKTGPAATNYPDFTGGDSEPPSVEYFREVRRVCQNLVIFGANHFLDRLALAGYNLKASCWLVWDKDNGTNDTADCELAWTDLPGAVRKIRYTWNGMLQQDMKNKQWRIHPTEKPIGLYRFILDKYTKPGSIILDTHVGSGSSLVACRQMNYDFIGYETHPYYFEKSSERLRSVQGLLL